MIIILIIMFIPHYCLSRDTALHDHQFITTLWVVIATFLLKEALARSLAAKFPSPPKVIQLLSENSMISKVFP